MDELKQQTIDAIKPSKSSVDCINDLLAHVFQEISNKFEEDNQQHDIWTVGWWDGPLEEKCVCIVVANSTFQPFESRRHGYIPYDIPRDCREWQLSEKIKTFHYITKGDRIYLIIDN